MIDNESFEEVKPPENLYVKLYAGKVMFENLEKCHLQEIELNGKSKVAFQDGIADFRKLKFSTTSYNHDVPLPLFCL